MDLILEIVAARKVSADFNKNGGGVSISFVTCGLTSRGNTVTVIKLIHCPTGLKKKKNREKH